MNIEYAAMPLLGWARVLLRDTVIGITRGGREVMPRGEWRVRPGHVEVHLLKAIPTRGLTYDDRDAVLDKLHQLAEYELA